MITEDRFIEDAKFAKVVNTFNGPALLIAGHVIEVKGEQAGFAEWIAKALRAPHTECGSFGSVGVNLSRAAPTHGKIGAARS